LPTKAIRLPQRALLVSRIPVLSQSVAALLSDVMKAPSLVSVGSPAEALAYLKSNLFDVIVCDASACSADLEPLVMAATASRKIFLDMECDLATSRALRLLGADAYIPWTLPTDEMRRVLHEVLSGRVWFGSPCAECPAQTVSPDQVCRRLSRRQRDVHRLLERGCSNKDIADALEMSPATVKIHVNAILKALGAKNRTEAAVYARYGLRACATCRLPGEAAPSRAS
jgi:DNA-binding NarL/FixJ family response regulator